MFNWIKKLKLWQRKGELSLTPLVMPQPDIWENELEKLLGKTEDQLKKEIDEFDFTPKDFSDLIIKQVRYRNLMCDYSNVKTINDTHRIQILFGTDAEREFLRARL